MIVTQNSQASKQQFESLLEETVVELDNLTKKDNLTVTELSGRKLEPFVAKIMARKAIGTVFEGLIDYDEDNLKFRFPDIVVKKYYGVEVKSTIQNHWKTTGNSVLESTRAGEVERIYMLFGKLGGAMKFQWRPYEQCLSEVVVTHSPRYLIDMKLEKGGTIFDKMKITYEDLRSRSNPIKPIVEYYKKKLRPGEDIWWLDQGENTHSSNLIIKIWTNLTKKEKDEIKIKAMAFFPEVFSNNSDKFSRVAIWLVTSEAIVCRNIRDLFTAGGKSDLVIGKKTFKKVPRILLALFENFPKITQVINQTSEVELTLHWQKKTSSTKKLTDWITRVEYEAKKMPDAKLLDIREMIDEYRKNN